MSSGQNVGIARDRPRARTRRPCCRSPYSRLRRPVHSALAGRESYSNSPDREPTRAFDGISLLGSRGGEFTERTLVLTGRGRPVETVSFAWSADKTPCVDALTCETLFGIFLLGGDVEATGVDRAHLVAADAAVNNFRAGELRIESPSIVQAHQPDGKREPFFSDNQHRL